MKEYIKIGVSVFVGVVFAGLFYWLVSTTLQNTSAINGVVSFLNSQIQASQKSSSPTPAQTK